MITRQMQAFSSPGNSPCLFEARTIALDTDGSCLRLIIIRLAVSDELLRMRAALLLACLDGYAVSKLLANAGTRSATRVNGRTYLAPEATNATSVTDMNPSVSSVQSVFPATNTISGSILRSARLMDDLMAFARSGDDDFRSVVNLTGLIAIGILRCLGDEILPRRDEIPTLLPILSSP
jgi:hypothetical protein